MNLPVPVNFREGLPFYKLVLRCAIFTILFCVVALPVILVTSIILYNTADPNSKAELGGLISLYVSTFITTFIMTRINKEKWLFGGLILGGMIFTLTFCLSVFVDGDATPHGFLYRLIVFAISLISAFLARKRESKRPKFKNHK